MPSTRTAFRRLHDAGCFVIPNPWDVGSARWLQQLGFPALATTSAGAAFVLGLPDGAVSRDRMLAHVRELVEATDVPVNADFGNGFADDPYGVAVNVRLCAQTGVAGLSIEDLSPTGALYPLDLAVARVRAARVASDDVVFTARAEGMLLPGPDLADVTRRLVAFADAGADCLYAPGLRTPEQITTVVRAVAPKPVNVLVSGGKRTVGQLAGLGVRRISVGSGLARAAWGGFVRAARAIATEGRFDGLDDALPYTEIDAFFRADAHRRGGG